VETNTANSAVQHDYDDVFKTIKSRHARLFIPVINEEFGTNYPLDASVEVLSSEGQFVLEEKDGTADIAERTSDLFLRIDGTVYLVEVQSYKDGSMAIRIAEYAFIAARQTAQMEDGRLTLTVPHFSVIYVRKSPNTPKTTEIRWRFPNGEVVEYSSKNFFVSDYTKEDIIEKELYPFIPYYITRYEMQLKKLGETGFEQSEKLFRGTDNKASEELLEQIEAELAYLGKSIRKAMDGNRLDAYTGKNLIALSNTVISHVVRDSATKERLVSAMGGNIITTDVDLIYEAGKSAGIAEGETQGEALLGRLMDALLNAGRIADAKKAATDEEARKQFYRELGMID
jgi:hypothetical protein